MYVYLHKDLYIYISATELERLLSCLVNSPMITSGVNFNGSIVLLGIQNMEKIINIGSTVKVNEVKKR